MSPQGRGRGGRHNYDCDIALKVTMRVWLHWHKTSEKHVQECQECLLLQK